MPSVKFSQMVSNREEKEIKLVYPIRHDGGKITGSS